MNTTFHTLAIAALTVGLCGAVNADNNDSNKVYSTSGADSQRMHNSDAKAKFSQLDSNKDGKLSQDELEAAGNDGKYANKWSTLDTNRDGAVDESEFQRFKANHQDKATQGTRSMPQDSNGANQLGTDRDRVDER
jgi:Ca2+-binding EF-hand superfamily protein